MYIRDDLYNKVTKSTPFVFEIWQPESIAVVLGSSQKPENELNLQQCREDGVPVLKRRGGGGAVVLMPGIVCFTIAFLSDAGDSPYYFFTKINNFIIAVLQEHFHVENLDLRGISDIAIGTIKILGCSIFKSRNLFHYQGSLLVNPDLAKIPHYLLHPSKEPDYRNGRSHLDFLTSLGESGYSMSVNRIKTVFEIEISNGLLKMVS